MHKVKVFAYNGIIGISAPKRAELEGNHIPECLDDDREGYLVDADKIEFSKEAVEILQSIPAGSLKHSSVELFHDEEHGNVMAWYGGAYSMLDPEFFEASDFWDPSVIKATDNVEIDEDFPGIVDEYLVEKKQLLAV